MLLAAPLMALVAVMVLVLDGRPIFYRQVRVGKRGKLFRILKFRTMRPHAEQETGAVWSCPGDPRVSRLGSWLRSSHLDELPQLINVLAGDMSLVGPRPERPEFMGALAAEEPRYTQRLLVKPGITGMAQLQLGYDETIVKIGMKVDHDLQYVESATLAMDMKLVLSTVPHVALELLSRITEKQPQPASSQRIAEASPETASNQEPMVIHPKTIVESIEYAAR